MSQPRQENEPRARHPEHKMIQSATEKREVTLELSKAEGGSRHSGKCV